MILNGGSYAGFGEGGGQRSEVGGRRSWGQAGTFQFAVRSAKYRVPDLAPWRHSELEQPRPDCECLHRNPLQCQDLFGAFGRNEMAWSPGFSRKAGKKLPSMSTWCPGGTPALE